MHRRRSEAVAASLGGRLYICGGHNGVHDLAEVEVLDLFPFSSQPHPSSSSSATKPPPPTWREAAPLSYGRQAAAAAVVAGKLVVCGGSAAPEPHRSVESLCPTSGVWEELPNMLEGRKGAVAAAVGGKLYVCGGTGVADGQRCVLQSMERFDPLMRDWEAFPSLGMPRSHAAAVAFAGLLHVFGGTSSVRRTESGVRRSRGRGRGAGRAAAISSGGEGLQSGEGLDPATGRWGRWEALPPMWECRSYPAAAVVPA